MFAALPKWQPWQWMWCWTLLPARYRSRLTLDTLRDSLAILCLLGSPLCLPLCFGFNPLALSLALLASIVVGGFVFWHCRLKAELVNQENQQVKASLLAVQQELSTSKQQLAKEMQGLQIWLQEFFPQGMSQCSQQICTKILTALEDNAVLREFAGVKKELAQTNQQLNNLQHQLHCSLHNNLTLQQQVQQLLAVVSAPAVPGQFGTTGLGLGVTPGLAHAPVSLLPAPQQWLPSHAAAYPAWPSYCDGRPANPAQVNPQTGAAMIAYPAAQSALRHPATAWPATVSASPALARPDPPHRLDQRPGNF